MNTTLGVYFLGAIDYTNNTARTINNSSGTTAGILTLNGATVNSVANTILRNSNSTLLTITNGSNTMGLELGNATNNIIQINHSGGISISSNITGTARNLTLSSINHGSGVLTLSGTNSYTGNTRIDSGVLQFTNQVSLYNNGVAATWSKDNLVVTALGTAIFTMGGAGQFTSGNINTLLGLSDSASNGFRSGATIGLDTSGGSVSYTNTIANPNSGSNVLNVTKLGANTLTLEQNNTYTGRTFISAGTLQLGNGGTTGSLSTSSSLRNNGTLTINRSNAVAQGTDFSAAPIIGTGSLIQAGAGTTTLSAANTYTGTTTVSNGVLALTNALAMQNSAYVTTGSNGTSIGLDVTSSLDSGKLTLGGLSGSVDLAGAFTAGYTGSVTNLILNPQGAQSNTYSGVIANGAMSLTKNGTGTQVLTGANTYTGTTTINAGTLSLSGATTGTIAASTGMTLNNGTLTLTNTTALEGAIDRISNTAGITSNGGTVNYTNTSGTGVNYAETMGAVDLVRGQLTFNNTNTQAGSQILTLADLTRTGSSNTSTLSMTGGPNTTTSQFLVTTKVGSATPAGQIIGPWFNTNGTAAGSADYAVYNAAGQVVGSGTAPSTENTWTTAANAYTVRTAAGGASGAAAAERLTTTRNMVGLRIDTFSSTATATNAGDFFTRTGNTLANGDPLVFAGVVAGLTANIPYYVINVGGNGANTFQVSTTPGGTAVPITADGSPTIVPGILLGSGANLGTTGILQQSGVTTVITPGTGGVVPKKKKKMFRKKREKLR